MDDKEYKIQNILDFVCIEVNQNNNIEGNDVNVWFHKGIIFENVIIYSKIHRNIQIGQGNDVLHSQQITSTLWQWEFVQSNIAQIR